MTNPLIEKYAPLVTVHGDALGFDSEGYIVGRQLLKGLRTSVFEGRDFKIAGPSLHNTLFDDFFGDTLDTRWSGAAGNDAQAVAPAVSAAVGGKVRMTTGDTTTVSESCVSLTHGLNWKAGNGGLVMEAKITPVTSVANVAYFVGFTDALATGSLELPMTLSTATMTAVADDCAGFLFDTAATTDVFYGAAVKATTATVFASSPACNAPVADTAMTLRVEIDTSGNVRFYQDGVYMGKIDSAITTTVALTPVVAAMARTTTSKSLDVDYVYAQQLRA